MSNSIKIILLNPPYSQPIIRDNFCCFTSKSNYLWPPVDLLYLSANLNHPQIKLIVIDAVVEKLSPLKCLAQIKNFKPNIIISLTGTASYTTDLDFLKTAILKTKAKLYLIGNTPAFDPVFFLKKYPQVTGIIHNFFGNDISKYFLEKNYIPNYLSYKKNRQIITGKINFINKSPLPDLLSPPQYQLFPIKKYSSPLSQKKPFVTVLTSFGCPYQCQFCIASQLNFLSREISDLEKEFDAIKQNQIKEIFFEDSTFNTNPLYTQSICQLLIDKNYQFSWHANIHSHNLDIKILKLMKKAGCHTLNIGVESGNSSTLQKYAPTKNIDAIKKAFFFCQKLKIRTLGFFIIGFPNEDKTLSQNTIDLAIQLNPNFASFSILTPDYGTPLCQEAFQKKLIKPQKISFDSSGGAILNNKNFTIQQQDQVIKKAYIQFYFRPKKIITYLLNIKNYPIYFQNGVTLFKNKILTKQQ